MVCARLMASMETPHSLSVARVPDRCRLKLGYDNGSAKIGLRVDQDETVIRRSKPFSNEFDDIAILVLEAQGSRPRHLTTT